MSPWITSSPSPMSSSSSSSSSFISPWMMASPLLTCPSLLLSSSRPSSAPMSSLSIATTLPLPMPSPSPSRSLKDRSWNELISQYASQGEWQHALILYEEMQREDSVVMNLSEYTFVILLKACIQLNDIKQGNSVYSEIARKGLSETNIFIGSTLVHMYAKFGMPRKAKEASDRLVVRNVVSWTSLINAYAQHGLGQEALECFEKMQEEGFSPNSTTFSCVLKACSTMSSIEKGQKIHAKFLMEGLSADLMIGNTLIDMYVKQALFASAQTVFRNLPIRDAISWTTLIGGYAQHGHCKEGSSCFEEMQLDGVAPNVVTFSEVLKCYCNMDEFCKGQDLHAIIVNVGLERELILGSSLIDMYARFFYLDEVERVFWSLRVRDVVSWNALIEAYVECGCGEEALTCLKYMQLEGFSPSGATFACSLKACATIGAVEKGEEIYSEISRKGLLENDVIVGNSLIHMYTSFGMVLKARDVFERLPIRDIVSWNSLITGCAHIGECREAFLLFMEMVGTRKQRPNLVTFLNLLGACSHGGLIHEGQTYFEAMNKDYGLTPTLEHYSCMADLLGRSGQLKMAVTMVKNLPCPANIVVWRTLLGACQKWCNVEIGREVFEATTRLNKKDAMAYVCMSNIYANAGLHEDAHKIEALRLSNQASNFSGYNTWLDSRCR